MKFGKISIALKFFLVNKLMIEGTVRNNRKEIPAECKITKALHETRVMKSKSKNNTYIIPLQEVKERIYSKHSAS